MNIEDKVNLSIKKIYKSLRNKGKIFFCGNGGSAADAQHLAAELLIRLRPKVNRSPIPAISLCMDSSTLTACGNDYSFDEIFSRPFEALANKEDVLIVISTSGNSKNIIQVLKKAKKNKILSIGFLGSKGGIAKKYCHIYRDKKEEVLELMIREFLTLLEIKNVDISHKDIHGWLYAFKSKDFSNKFYWNKDINLGICGDWMCGPKAEDAWSSATLLANQINNS